MHVVTATTTEEVSNDRGHRHGPQLLEDALASLVCEIVAEHPTGDHWIVVGRVDDLHVSPIGNPLVCFAGAFGAVQPA